MSDAILVGVDLTKTFGDLTVIRGASIAVGEGEFVSLVGKSGCGKTTLLALLSGLESPSSGRVTIAGKEISDASEDELALFRRENVGFIFQSFNLIPTLSAWENTALPLFPVSMTEGERRRRAMELLDRMELGNRAEHLPAELSGGEKPRVDIARAREIGILKAVGWTGADVRKQIMGEVFVQALLGGIAGIVAGYLIAYLLGTLSIPVTTPWEINLTPAFAKDAAAVAEQTIRLPVHLSARLITASLALSLAAGGLANYFMARRMAKMKPADILRQL